MSTGVKTVLYVALALVTVIFGVLAFRDIKQGIAYRNAADARRLDQASDTGSPTAPSADSTNEAQQSIPGAPATNAVQNATNRNEGVNGLAAINQLLGATNVSAAMTNLSSVSTAETNLTNAAMSETVTNPAPSGSTAKVGKVREKKKVATSGDVLAKGSPKHMWMHIGLLVVSGLGLGFLAAWDFSQSMGTRALNVIYNDNLEGMKDPDYDLAEAEWANGRHLDAVRMMRDYLNKHPREQHVSLRIAEIYEKDLNNPLAAALEYEQVLTKKLPSERWGWAAIHLCNLYFKLNEEGKAVDLLKRIDSEYGQTAAAEKARKRMQQMNIPTSLDEVVEEEVEPEETKTQQKGPKLPPGFGPRKG